MKKIQAAIAFLLVLTISGCSATPKYLNPEAKAQIQQNKTDLMMAYEVLTLTPERENTARECFQYDLSSIPENATIKCARLKVGIQEKAVLARSLNGAMASHLALVVKPTSFYGGTIMAPGCKPVFAENSTIEFEADSLSALQRMGGTGGKATYLSKNQGYDEYDISELVTHFLTQNKPLTFKLANKINGLSDQTIFSNSYVLTMVKFSRLAETEHVTQLTVFYE